MWWDTRIGIWAKWRESGWGVISGEGGGGYLTVLLVKLQSQQDSFIWKYLDYPGVCKRRLRCYIRCQTVRRMFSSTQSVDDPLFCKGNVGLAHISALMMPPLGRERRSSMHLSQQRQIQAITQTNRLLLYHPRNISSPLTFSSVLQVWHDGFCVCLFVCLFDFFCVCALHGKKKMEILAKEKKLAGALRRKAFKTVFAEEKTCSTKILI